MSQARKIKTGPKSGKIIHTQRSKILRGEIRNLQADREALSSQASPNRNLLSSIDRKIMTLTGELEEAERQEAEKKLRHERHINDRKHDMARKGEQAIKKEIRFPKPKFSGTLRLSSKLPAEG